MPLMLDAAMFDDSSVAIQCPKCGDKTECPVARLRLSQDFVCPTCDARFHINAAGQSSDRDTAGESADYFLSRISTWLQMPVETPDPDHRLPPDSRAAAAGDSDE